MGDCIECEQHVLHVEKVVCDGGQGIVWWGAGGDGGDVSRGVGSGGGVCEGVTWYGARVTASQSMQ